MKTDPLHDTQSQPDDRNIPIDRVGVRRLRYPIQVRDRDHTTQSTIATVQLTVDLPHNHKGTHMSRFIEVLNSHGPVLHIHNIREILEALRRKLNAEAAHLEFEFPYFMEKSAPATGSRSLMDYNVRLEANLHGAKFDFVLVVMVPVTTLCPCSKAISRHGAHNQRSIVTLAVRFRKPVWIEDLIALVEASASSELYSLLKRADEKVVTERAYENPVFVEDLVRNVAVRASQHPDITWYRVEAENFESIHNHNAYALVESHNPLP